MQVTDRFYLNIESIAFGGEGVGRIDNFVVFVPFSAPGDVVETEISEAKKKFARGRLIRVEKPSPWRVPARCSYFGKCGGCNYQHIIYPEQLKIKTKQVEEVFRRIGKMETPPVQRIIASPEIYAYRGKAQFHAVQTPRGLKIGFMDTSGGKVVDIKRCEIMEESINDQLRRWRNRREFPLRDGLIIWSQASAGETKDTDAVRRTVLGRELLAAGGGFFQANLWLTDRLVEEVCRLAGKEKVGTIVDAYCGSGLFSIFLACLAEQVIGIEQSCESVKYARVNAARWGARNIEFIADDVETVFRQAAIRRDKRLDLLVLDPPRTGCPQSLLAEIAGRDIRKIIYISCNPATQARDIKFLAGCGYSVVELLPLDMFPQTQHIEVLALLIRR